MRLKWRFHFSATAMLLYFALTGRFADYVIVVLSVVAHEIGHLLCAKMVNASVASVRFMVYGAEIKFQSSILTSKQQLIIASGGPLVTAILYVFFSIDSGGFSEQIAHVQKVLLLINLCPIWPLDGGVIFMNLGLLLTGKDEFSLLYVQWSFWISLVITLWAFWLKEPFYVLLFSVVCVQAFIEWKNWRLYNAFRKIVTSN